MKRKDEISPEIKDNSTESVDLSLENKKVENEDSRHQIEDDSFDGVIDLTATRKKRFHVNRGLGSDGVLELNTSDMSILNRLENLYPRLQKLSEDAALKQISVKDEENERVTSKVSQALARIDAQMRQIIDEIFDANVSEVCAPSGSMFDPFNGEFRFEHIIDVISKLYENNINSEYKKMSDKMKKRTSKYTHKG